MLLQLPNQLLNGKITAEDVLGMYEEMEKKMILSEITFPTVPSSDGYYHVWIPDKTAKSGRRQMKGKNLEKLKDRVYQKIKEQDVVQHYTFKETYNMAQDSKLNYIKDPEKRLSSYNTIKVNNSVYKRFFDSTEFENKYIDAISKDDIEDFCLEILRESDVKKKAFMNLRSIIHSTFKYAYENYWIQDNPYTRINFRKFDDMLIRPVSLKKRVHSEKEVAMILDYIHVTQARKPAYMPAYALELQILIGSRRGEIPPLMWDDIINNYIFIHREQITVNKTKYNKKVHDEIVEHTKTYKDRMFPITNDVQDLLDRLERVHELYHLDSEYLFPYNNDNGVITNQITYKYYTRICKDLNIVLCREFIKGTHSFRRNAITKAVNKSGGNIFLVSQLYGNSPNVAEKNYYTGVDISQVKEILER